MAEEQANSKYTKLTVKVLFVVGIFFLLYLVVNYLYLRWALNKDIISGLARTDDKIVSDLAYKNGRWDTSSYVNDNQISQTNPLYVITTDGFIIDREQPISGLLDTSDFKFNSSFPKPTTITSPAGEEWRIYSNGIMKDDTVVGAVTVGYYEPEQSALADIDRQLVSAADTISSQVIISSNGIDTSKITAKNVNIKVSYEIVDKFNHALQSVGGLPSYIDRSYVSEWLMEKYTTVKEQNTGALFLVYSKPILDVSKTPIGIVVAGFPLAQINNTLQKQLIFSSVSGVIDVLTMCILLVYLLRKEISALIEKASRVVQKTFYVSQRSGSFGFDKDTGIVYLTERKMEIPVKSKQYYICKLMFSKPNKNWENDEIMDKLPPEILEVEAGDMYDNPDTDIIRKRARMIYDSIRLLNEKSNKFFGLNLILLQGGTYRINPNA